MKKTAIALEPDDTKRLLATSLSSIIAGCTSRLICHPIDTLKAKVQVPIHYNASL